MAGFGLYPFGEASFGGVSDLVIQSASHGHTADAANPSIVWTLSSGSGQHGHSTDSAALTQTHGVNVARPAHRHRADAVTLDAGALVANEVLHGHSAEAVALTQVHELSLASSAHGHSVDAAVLDTPIVDISFGNHPFGEAPFGGGFYLTAQDSRHTQTAASPTLNPAGYLAVAEARHRHRPDHVSLSGVHDLGDGEGNFSALHAHTADAGLTLTQVHVLAPADGSHGHAVDAVDLAVYDLAVQHASHGHAAEVVLVTQTHVLGPQEASHGLSSDPLVLTQAHVLAPADGAHSHSADATELDNNDFLWPQESRHRSRIDHASLTQTHVLDVVSSRHASTADSATVSTLWDLVVDDAGHHHTTSYGDWWFRYLGVRRTGGLAAPWLRFYAHRYTSAILRSGIWQESDGLDEDEIMGMTEGVDYFVGGRMYDITPAMHAELESAGLT